VGRAKGAAARAALLDRFVAALQAEWRRERERFAVARLETVFIGGGTPSLLGEERLERLLAPFQPLLTPHAEVTVETNPEDVSGRYAAWAARRGVRVSLGVQGFDVRLRETLGRRAEADPEAAFLRLRDAGVGAAGRGAVSIDLIFGMPAQTLADVDAELETVARLRPDHVSWYELSVVPGTALAARVALTDAGRLGWQAPELPDDDTTAEMYRRIVAGLGRRGYEWYEVSNFARPGRRCRHNSAVWRGRDYLGLGPGAVGTVAGIRRRDLADVGGYLAALQDGGAPPREEEALAPDGRRRERLLLAARTGERVTLAELAGILDDSALAPLAAAGLVSATGGTLRVTRKGRYVANAVCVRLFRDSSFMEA
jgi:oxygen-independent coproporphyrinogen-3 oxidase